MKTKIFSAINGIAAEAADIRDMARPTKAHCLPLQNDEGQHAEDGARGRERGDDQHGSLSAR